MVCQPLTRRSGQLYGRVYASRSGYGDHHSNFNAGFDQIRRNFSYRYGPRSSSARSAAYLSYSLCQRYRYSCDSLDLASRCRPEHNLCHGI